MAKQTLEQLFGRYCDDGDVGALAEVFDRAAPELLSLALRLIGGTDRAEDLVQDTFLVAVEQRDRFDRGERLQPWLVGILVNRARSARRRDRRPLELDRLAERLTEREVAEPAVELDRDERRAAVGAALEELPAPMRAVVEAKLAGRDAGETARELGISRGAVRVRLHRALARMRAVLPPSLATPFALLCMHTTGLGAARGRVLRTARGQLSKTGTASAGLGFFPGLAIGWTWMTKQSIAALGLALVGLTWMGLGTGAAPAGGEGYEGEGRGWAIAELPTAGDPEQHLVDPRPAPSRSLPAVVESAPESDLAASAGGTLSGTVLGPAGVPVGEALVEAWLVDRWVRDYVTRGPDMAVEADERGRFVLTGLAGRFVVSARGEGLACARGLAGELADGQLAEELTLELVRARRMFGTVVDPRGRPVEGAEVVVGDPANGRLRTEVPGVESCPALRGFAVTDGQGGFVLEGLCELHPRLTVTRAGFLVYRNYATGGGRERIETQIRPDGNLAFSMPDPNQEIDASVPAVVRLEAGLVLSGVVLDADGKAAQGARVRRIRGDETFPAEVSTDARGRFELRGLRPLERTPHGLVVQHDGHAIEVLQPLEARPFGQAGPDVLIELERERVLSGSVVSSAGDPVAGVMLQLVGERTLDPGYGMARPLTWEWFVERDVVETDDRGRFLFDGLKSGRYRVQTQGVPPDQHAVLEAPAGASDLRIVLGDAPGTVTIDGSVRTPGGLAVERFFVTPRIDLGEGSWGGEARAFQDGSGAFSIAGLEPGPIELVFEADGCAERVLPREDFSAGNHRRDVLLAPACSLELSFSDTTGQPVACTIRILDGRGRPVWPRIVPALGSPHRVERVSVPKQGVLLEDLPAESITVEVLEWEERFQIDLSRVTGDRDGPHEEHLVLAESPLATLHLLVLSAGALNDPEGLIEVWREQRGQVPAIHDARPDLWTGLSGPQALLSERVELGLTDVDGTGLAWASAEPGELSFELDGGAPSSLAKWVPVTFPGALPHVAWQVPAGKLRIVRLVKGDLELVGEVELLAGEERWEGLTLGAE